MSYLCATDSPEGLEIISDMDGYVYIIRTLADNRQLHIPIKVFENLFMKWGDSQLASTKAVKYRCASIQRMPDSKYKMTFKDWELDIVMWRSTLLTIFHEIQVRHKQEDVCKSSFCATDRYAREKVLCERL